MSIAALSNNSHLPKQLFILPSITLGGGYLFKPFKLEIPDEGTREHQPEDANNHPSHGVETNPHEEDYGRYEGQQPGQVQKRRCHVMRVEALFKLIPLAHDRQLTASAHGE